MLKRHFVECPLQLHASKEIEYIEQIIRDSNVNHLIRVRVVNKQASMDGLLLLLRNEASENQPTGNRDINENKSRT